MNRFKLNSMMLALFMMGLSASAQAADLNTLPPPPVSGQATPSEAPPLGTPQPPAGVTPVPQSSQPSEVGRSLLTTNLQHRLDVNSKSNELESAVYDQKIMEAKAQTHEAELRMKKKEDSSKSKRETDGDVDSTSVPEFFKGKKTKTKTAVLPQVPLLANDGSVGGMPLISQAPLSPPPPPPDLPSVSAIAGDHALVYVGENLVDVRAGDKAGEYTVTKIEKNGIVVTYLNKESRIPLQFNAVAGPGTHYTVSGNAAGMKPPSTTPTNRSQTNTSYSGLSAHPGPAGY